MAAEPTIATGPSTGEQPELLMYHVTTRRSRSKKRIGFFFLFSWCMSLLFWTQFNYKHFWAFL